MKKRISFLLLATLILTLPLLSGCTKKGEEDPFISLRSRKDRIVGKWMIKEYALSYTDIYASGRKNKVDLSFSSGTNVTKTIESIQTGNDTIITWTGSIVEGTIEFDKDGEMEFYLDYTIDRDSTYRNEDTEWQWDFKWTEQYRNDYKGTWNFLGKIDNFKNKERITFVWTTQIIFENFNQRITATDPDNPGNPTYSDSPEQNNYTKKYANGEAPEIWQIVQLRNKEIKLYRPINDDLVSKVQTSTSSSSTSFGRIGTETITLSLRE